MPLEVFQAPATLREQLIEFQARQPCHPLNELDQLKDELSLFHHSKQKKIVNIGMRWGQVRPRESDS